MREIKFRGKSLYNGKWVYGYAVKIKTNKPTEVWAIKDTVYHINDGCCDLIPEEVIPETIGQFTGLADKNGKEIFEGDIVFNKNRTLITCKEDPKTYLVEWIDGKYRKESDGITWLYQKPSFVFSKIQVSGLRYMTLVFSQEQIEIIGNIHDNPELLNPKI